MRDALLDIVRSGILAPSADNEHVFRFELLSKGIRLWPTPAFATATGDLPRVLGLLSMGAVLENMQLRAGQLGLTLDAHWLPITEDQPMLDLQASTSLVAPEDLANAIPERHTNRRMYHGPGLTEVESAALNEAVAPVQGTRLVWLQGAQRRQALKLIWAAESERFLRQQLHHDIYSSIRFDTSWTDSTEWSLPPGALEIEMPMRPFFKALRHWPLMRWLNWLGVHRLVGLRAGWLPAWQAPALGVLVTSLPLTPGAVAVGRALERLWLRCSLLELAFQPLAASAVLMQTSCSEGGASGQLRATLAQGWQGIAPGSLPLMVFRLGRAARPSVRSGRRPVADYAVLRPDS